MSEARTVPGTVPRIVVVGAGPGVGGAVARRFGRDGYAVALISRSPDQLSTLAADLAKDGIEAEWAALDLTDEAALTAAVTGFGQEPGGLAALHFNPSAFRQKNPLTLSRAELLADVDLGVGALLTAVQAARPYLAEGGRVLVTGSMAADEPWSEAASLGVQKAGVRNLVRSLDATLRPHGIRAVSVTVRGSLAPGDETSVFHPARVAEAIFAAAHQPEATWRSEVPYPA